MRFLRLLILLPVLCLDLLGQGQGWVLCQESCGCVAVEMAHAPHAHQACAAHEACGCRQAPPQKCHDVALGTDLHVASKPMPMPDLARFAVGALDWPAPQVRSQGVGAAAGVSARGPPPLGWETCPPQILACVRSVVMLV